jgi:hypothetical protein
MVVGTETRLARRFSDSGRDRSFDAVRRREILDATAVRTDQVVMVLGEILSQLVARELVVGEHPVHDARLLEYDEVPVHRALGQTSPLGKDLRDREGAVGGGEHFHDVAPTRGHALSLLRESAGDRVAQIFFRGALGHAQSLPTTSAGTVGVVDPTARFAACVADDVDSVRLDVAALSIAAHAHPDLDIDVSCARLDALAQQCPGEDFEALRAFLFERLAFRGNRAHYNDPENSFLDSVLERRLGIPITLSIVCIEVGRRVGIAVHGVGMPGHFLVQADGAPYWCDPFNGGARLDVEDCRRVFDALYGGARQFDVALLSPTAPRAILSRMLTNLEHGPLGADPAALVWMCRLHLAIPGLAFEERLQLARRLVAVADPGTVQTAYESVAATAPDQLAGAVRDEARRLAARRN